jgi:hypothetical protein
VEKSVGGGGAILVVDGDLSGPCHSVQAPTELGVELKQRQRAHSTCCMVAMA